MSELSPEARHALSALREQAASDAEQERVRARLAALGIVAVSTSAVALSASAAAASVVGVQASGAAIAASTASVQAAAGSLAASSASLTAVGTTSIAAPAAVAATSASVVTLTAPVASVGLAAKLASLPFVVKATVAATVLVSSVAVPLTRHADAPAPRVKVAAHRQGDVHEAAARHETQARPTKPAAHPPLQAFGSAPPTIEASSEQAADTAEELKRPAAKLIERRIAQTQSQAPVPASRLGEESTLLRSALDAVRAGDAPRARSFLDRHQSQFGDRAFLARERERIRNELPPNNR